MLFMVFLDFGQYLNSLLKSMDALPFSFSLKLRSMCENFCSLFSLFLAKDSSHYRNLEGDRRGNLAVGGRKPLFKGIYMIILDNFNFLAMCL